MASAQTCDGSHLQADSHQDKSEANVYVSTSPSNGKARHQGDYLPLNLFRLSVFNQADGLPEYLPLVRQQEVLNLLVAPNQGVLYAAQQSQPG